MVSVVVVVELQPVQVHEARHQHSEHTPRPRKSNKPSYQRIHMYFLNELLVGTVQNSP